ncbi:cobaltochelatase subunit CobN [Rhizobium rhizosphaerae]|uniref:Cobaltochelatase subunit CobN n=1 Tax=Xaviernesmea rhizosphaerae TaxID=1672749 RepID=A0A1Q9AND9_9HYPH|nr:cobaltochelatase subunit CobN [Xaviernesmea rhizosphaerae]OLP56918.1 cobaltochelatase subunit CobN [Xaviernesmea rhizosphaerae]
MHLLLAQKGTIADGEEAIDLGQSPGDLLFLSAADTELSAVAAAHGALMAQRQSGLTLRVASLLALKHPMSVDTYVARMVAKARLIVIRPLGGASYFGYLLEAFHAAARAHGVAIAVIPGCEKPDPGLAVFATVGDEDRAALWDYFLQGGEANMRGFLAYAEALVSGGDKPPAASPLLKAGIWWPGRGMIARAEWQALLAASHDHAASASAQPQGSMSRPLAALCFYRALVQSGETAAVAALVEALRAEGLDVLPVFVASLKDAVSVATLETLFAATPPDVVLNATGFAVSAPGADRKPTVLEASDAPVLQVVFAGSSRESWEASGQGLLARDLAMNIALPEVDGRIISRAVSFKSAGRYDERVEATLLGHEPVADRMAFVASLAANWARLRRTPRAQRRVALLLSNYPSGEGRIGNGVGLDTPEATAHVLAALSEAGYALENLPADGAALMARLTVEDGGRATYSIKDYKDFLRGLPVQIQDEVTARWGAPEADPSVVDGAFRLKLLRLGNVALAVQPPRAPGLDPKDSYHAADLVPPHGYLALYAWLRRQFKANALIHMGKHGTLEWLPGKALALSARCYPEAILGPLPHLYPFIVNDPGEGTQAKRRTAAVIIDHLTPPLTRAESYGPLKELERLVDEYYDAAGGDPRRLKLLTRDILGLVRDLGLDSDAGIRPGDGEADALKKLDAYLCDLKEMQIRDGLHVFGRSPEGRLADDLVTALARATRGEGTGAGSLQRAIARDLGLQADDGTAFDPLDCDAAAAWTGKRPEALAALADGSWRSAGDTVERIEALASRLVAGAMPVPEDWRETAAVIAEVETVLKPAVAACGPAEIDGLLRGLDGRFVAPGPSGAPTRGRPDVLPTGRNFYSVDSRAVPTPAAYELGRKSAELLIRRYLQDHGDWPTSFGLTAWGTANMRTGGDDIAQAMALIGTRPVWDPSSHRVTGYEILPLALLGRPRVDVTLRVSGFFRDAFPDQIALFDRAIAAVGALEEDEGDNRIAARMRADAARLTAEGLSEREARRRAAWRIFGAEPGTYGAGLEHLLGRNALPDRESIAKAYLDAGGFAYGAGEAGTQARDMLESRLRTVEAVVQNQDNREHDLLDSDGYFQFEGGMGAAVATLSGAGPRHYHNDHSRPERPVIRSLEEEIGRVVRGRVVNPKWIAGMMRHGYKGAFEIAATVDYLCAFAATTGAVSNHHFEAVHRAFVLDEAVRDFMEAHNPAARADMLARLDQAVEAGLWQPRSNSARFGLRAAAL